jgi:hypothetical protein
LWQERASEKYFYLLASASSFFGFGYEITKTTSQCRLSFSSFEAFAIHSKNLREGKCERADNLPQNILLSIFISFGPKKHTKSHNRRERERKAISKI